ncbi:beta-insect excitatory toxin OdTx12-like [Centruroides vittatus]|uniref:beta-insect excitatory toxin OdTx12-like n=1 Tax=Centruroides vittatus TaxID=120091 RepID=UPI00350F24B3
MQIVILFFCFVGTVLAAKRHGYIIVEGEPIECATGEEKPGVVKTDFCDGRCRERGAKTGVCCFGGCICYDVADDKEIVDTSQFRNRICEYLTKVLDK